MYDAFISEPELFNNYVLVIAGKGTNTVVSSGQDNNVLFLNRYIKDSEVAYLFKNAKAVVYPYISATQSGVLTLAFFFGTPILASDVPFFKEFIDNRVNGMLFRNGDVDNLKESLLELLNNDTSFMSEKEIEFYEKHYTKGVQREILLTIYQSINL